MTNTLHINIAPHITQALKENTPVVALESTIITHGMPYPKNVETAREVEKIIQDNGAVPATIAIIDGVIEIGISEAGIEDLAKRQNVLKLSRADLAFAISEQKTGATTVAATMICARLGGIDVFATGGIGGVHRGAELSFDVSADLQELAITDTIVVCAGAKALLDISKTLEVLETGGVPVMAFQTDEFPAFWSRSSGLPCPLRADSAKTIADTFIARRKLNLDGGLLVANPVPAEFELARETIEPAIIQALQDAENEGIRAKDVTPYILDKIFQITNGASLETNIALIKNNAALAAQIAIELVKTR
ncbi:MAG: pseudouridine-5'-phosphate glycosidase [Cohaesibacteraceae bacterium]|nr:pseudouridine-5'-phosphate glycosidase [Cohaesibacteraceae bacterium]MBL4875582.1 pseudouridine-5'-phosphate glycosidase [Cohaesibacteraceae bacterium]